MITFALFLITFLAIINGSQQITCDENEFTCGNGDCIDNFLVCDGEKNCRDGSDETKSVCSKSHIVRCQPFAFRCAYGACIDEYKKCNGKQDCADNSDELHPDCSSSTVTTSNSNCTFGSFECDSGQCISEWSVCDGEANCRDGSDESDIKCLNFPCPQIVGFQCNYGGCIDKDKRCNGVKNCRDGSDEDPILCGSPTNPISPPEQSLTPSPSLPALINGCELPKQPDGGIFTVADCLDTDVSDKCRRIPGTQVPEYTSLKYRCADGFNISDPRNNVKYCINSVWYPDSPLECLELCDGLKSSSVDIVCSRLGQLVNCSDKVLPGTKARLKCKDKYRLQSATGSPEIICRKGRWSEPVFRCTPECGIRTADLAKPLIRYGQNTSAVEYPWAAGLYSATDNELFCGGSIISPFMILTVAHCMYDRIATRKLIKANSLRIAVGKTNRSWEIIDPGEQRFRVSRIYVHSDYRGDDNNYAFDIAILELASPIIISRVAMPVCMEQVPPWTVIPNGTPGVVVGWGQNENDELSDQLMWVEMKYVDQSTCKRKSSFIFKKFITHDKFCADYNNGAGVQQGDSGGGLVFLKPENGLYYIHGLVSIKRKDQNSFATFTNISAKTHVDFIQETRLDIMQRHD